MMSACADLALPSAGHSGCIALLKLAVVHHNGERVEFGVVVPSSNMTVRLCPLHP